MPGVPQDVEEAEKSTTGASGSRINRARKAKGQTADTVRMIVAAKAAIERTLFVESRSNHFDS